jgi:hypothetical protein
MPDGGPVIDGIYIVVLENGSVTLGEEHLAQTNLRDVPDTEQDRLPKSGGNPFRVFDRVSPILFQGTDMSNVTSVLIKSEEMPSANKRLRIVPPAKSKKTRYHK